MSPPWRAVGPVFCRWAVNAQRKLEGSAKLNGWRSPRLCAYTGRMDEFAALLALLQNPGEDGVPASIYDDLSANYNGMMEGSNAKIGEQTTRIQELESEISKLKAVNYDLLMAVPSGDSEPDSDDSDNDSVDDDDTSDRGIDDLF